MRTYVIRKLLLMIPAFVGVSIIVFLMIHLSGGNPIYMIVGSQASQEYVDMVTHNLGLDKPLYIQYLIFMKNIFTGNFGRSITQRTEVLALILQRLPNTVNLCGIALILSYMLAIPLGIISAVKRGTLIDTICMTFAVIGIATPQFWLGLILLLIFSVKLGWFPVMGYGDLKHLFLPVITLSGYYISLAARATRSSLLDSLSQDYIRTARAKGVSQKMVLYKHALKNSMIPVITLFGMELGWLIGGAVVVETVFSRPGLGRLLINSIYSRDYPVVQSLILLLALSVMLANLLADILYAVVDPRIRYN